MADDVAISVEHVSKDFVLPHERVTKVKDLFTSLFRRRIRTKEKQHALKDVSFEVKKGEFFGIVGRNGSGKSTMLKMLAGIYQPTKGKVHVNGKLVPFIELGVGFNPELTGRENVYMNGAMMGFSQKQTDAMYDDIVAFAELEDFMDQKLKNYSSGMQVRLAFSVAVRAEADVLLVDEVLAVGDADFQRKCYKYFKSLKRDKKTVIFVTHDMDAVQQYCDRAILIRDGSIAFEGKPSKVSAEYLKMFNRPEKTENTSSNRWGNRQVALQEPSVQVDDACITIRFTITNKADKTMDDVLLSMDIKDESDKLVAGNSFKEISQKYLRLKPNEQKSVTLQMPNNFGGGSYFLDISLNSNDRITIYDHWYHACAFENVIGRSAYFPIMLEATVKVED